MSVKFYDTKKFFELAVGEEFKWADNMGNPNIYKRTGEKTYNCVNDTTVSDPTTLVKVERKSTFKDIKDWDKFHCSGKQYIKVALYADGICIHNAFCIYDSYYVYFRDSDLVEL